MRRTALAAAALVGFASFGTAPAHAQPTCIGLPCAVVNAVCILVTHQGCVG